MASHPTISGNPYIGPRTFQREQGRVFFGREREARDLSARVMSERLLLFYAQSGAGKSSLINARLIPNLQKNGYAVLPVARVSGDLPSTVQAVDNIFLFNLMTSLLDKNAGDPARFASLSLKDFLAGLASDDGTTFTYEPATADELEPEQPATPTPYVLILDQFEEIVTAHPGRWQERTAFFNQLNQALLDDPNLWVLLTLREDYVAALDPYKPLMFNRLHATFFMERMAEVAALDAVRRPAELGGRPFAARVAEKLVDDLLQVRVPGQETTIKGQYVEPVQLQVVCYQLWQTLTANAPLWQASDMGKKPVEITFEDLEMAGDVNQALERFYDDTLQDTLRELQETSVAVDVGERQLRSWFEDELITEVGTRGLMRQGDAMTGTLPNTVVKKLQVHFLVRAETRSGDTWFELIHDRFVEPVRSSNLRWKQQRRREQPWIDAAYGWYESGVSPEKRNAGLLLADLNLKTVLADTAGQQFEPVVVQYLEASKEAQEKRDQAAALDTERAKTREVEDRLAKEAKIAGQLRRQRIALAALAGGIALLLLLVGGLALSLRWEGDKVKAINENLRAAIQSLEISRTELIALNASLSDETLRADEAERAKESVTLARIVSRLDLDSEDQRQFALLLSQAAMAISPTLQAESASIEALDAAYRHQAGWQPLITPTVYFTQAIALPFSSPLTMTLRRDGEALAAVVDGREVVVALDPSDWVTRSVPTSFARIGALALSDDGKLVAVAGCGQKPSPGDPKANSCSDWRIEVLPITSQFQFTRTMRLDETVGGVKALAFHPFMLQLVAATEDGSLLHWRLSASEPVAQQVAAGQLDDLVDLTVSPDGKYLAALDGQGRNRVWTWATWDGQDDDWPSDLTANSYRGVTFVRKGQWFATLSNCPEKTSENGAGELCPALRLWQRGTQAPIGQPIDLDEKTMDVAFGELTDSLTVLYDQRLVRWNLDPADWPELVCQRAGRTLTYDEWKEAFPGEDLTTYKGACSRPPDDSFVQARIAEATKKLDDCNAQGRDAGWQLLEYGGIPRLPTAVSILVEQALSRFDPDPDDTNGPAASCLVQANALLKTEGQPEIPLDEALQAARRLLDAESKLSTEPAFATRELDAIQEQLGQWSVDLDSRLAADYLALCFDHGFQDACNAVQEMSASTIMTYGDRQTGEIVQGNEGTPWYFNGERGQAVTIAMDAVGDSFDTELYLDGPGGRLGLAYNDEARGSHNSFIENFALPEDGMYRIRPQAYSGAGAYRLSLQERDLPVLEIGVPVSATTEAAGPWLFAGTEGQIVALDMETAEPVSGASVALERLDGSSSWSGYSAEGSTTARLAPVLLPADDKYSARVYLNGLTVPYTLTLRQVEPLPLELGETQQSTLAAGGLWSFSGQLGQIISASVATSDTAALPALSLLSSRGESLTYAASDGATGSARIPSYILREDEPYFVRVEGLDAQTPYQLRVDPIEPGELSVGQTVPSSTDGDTLWNLNAAPGQIVQISLRASAGSGLDTLIRLFDGAGQLVSSDDDGGAGYDSLLTLILPDSQSYLVQADRFSGGGAFDLSVSELTPQALPLDGSPASLAPDRAWSLTGQVGQVLTVTIQDAGDSSVPNLTLVTADGVALASSDGGQSLAAVLPQDGDYYLFASNIADSGEDSMTASLTDAVDATNLNEAASQTLYRLAIDNVIDEALSLYRWGTADGAVQFTADARMALCWHGALRGAVGDVIEVCEDLPNSAETTDSFMLAVRRDVRGLARALSDSREGAIEDFEYFVANGYDSYQVEQRREWIDRLRAGDPVSAIFDEATLEALLQQ